MQDQRRLGCGAKNIKRKGMFQDERRLGCGKDL